MTEAPFAMSAERFAALAAAYGAVMETWPASERSAGRAFALTPQGRHILARAGRLDLALRGIGEHGCIRLQAAGQGNAAAPAPQARTAAGLPQRLAAPVRRSRSDKLEALLSGSSSHA
ncbi:hypothetical protein [Labrys neptuniae]|uniref:Uncharacterized protein n=1 Tax=Labrys neptuniae TaxID=376174 RepID=A0ABV3PXE7_9HYPH